jgi:hypothetical protein
LALQINHAIIIRDANIFAYTFSKSKANHAGTAGRAGQSLNLMHSRRGILNNSAPDQAGALPAAAKTGETARHPIIWQKTLNMWLPVGVGRNL